MHPETMDDVRMKGWDQRFDLIAFFDDHQQISEFFRQIHFSIFIFYNNIYYIKPKFLTFLNRLSFSSLKFSKQCQLALPT
jgi:hypothetical protein